MRIQGAADAVVVQGHDLAGLDVADEFGAHDLEGAGFAADHVSVVQFADAERFDAVFVAAGIDAVAGHDHEGETAFDHVQGLDDGRDTLFVAALLDQVRQQLAVRVGLENGSVPFQVFAYLARIHQVAFAGDGEIARVVPEIQRLDVVQAALGGVGVLDAADAHAAGQVVQFAVGEDLAQQALAAVAVADAVLIEGDDAAAFLAAVLQVVQAVIYKGRGAGDAGNCKYSHGL